MYRITPPSENYITPGRTTYQQPRRPRAHHLHFRTCVVATCWLLLSLVQRRGVLGGVGDRRSWGPARAHVAQIARLRATRPPPSLHTSCMAGASAVAASGLLARERRKSPKAKKMAAKAPITVHSRLVLLVVRGASARRCVLAAPVAAKTPAWVATSSPASSYSA